MDKETYLRCSSTGCSISLRGDRQKRNRLCQEAAFRGGIVSQLTSFSFTRTFEFPNPTAQKSINRYLTDTSVQKATIWKATGQAKVVFSSRGYLHLCTSYFANTFLLAWLPFFQKKSRINRGWTFSATFHRRLSPTSSSSEIISFSGMVESCIL